MSMKLTIGAVGAAVLAAGAAGYALWQNARLEEELMLRPKVVVMDVSGELLAKIEAGENADEAAADLNEVGQRLVDAGYVVLEKRYVFAYDKAIEVTP